MLVEVFNKLLPANRHESCPVLGGAPEKYTSQSQEDDDNHLHHGYDQDYQGFE